MKIFLPGLFLVFYAASALAQDKDWQGKWDQILAGAKREGKVVVSGNPAPDVRRDLPAKFTARFGIPVEYIGGRTAALAARIRNERAAGLYSTDVFISSISTMATIFYPEKWLDPIKPILLLPEVVDPSKWKRGSLWFQDPEQVYLPRMLNYVSRLFYVNTRHAKVEEFKSIKELLNPRWKGKIAIDDPVGFSSGTSTASYFYQAFGEDFVKGLYIDQKPVFSRDRRQLTDWLAHGAYPIVFGASESEVDKLREGGVPLDAVFHLPDAPVTVGQGFGTVGLINRAPHPNAARVFINWLLSKEGMETYSRGYKSVTTRNDVDESFLDPREIPHPGVKYLDSADWEYATTGEERINIRMKELLRRR
jgi:iron(III) transport system substrate-binding protein